MTDYDALCERAFAASRDDRLSSGPLYWQLATAIRELRERNAEHEQFRHQHRDCDAMGVGNQHLRTEVERLRGLLMEMRNRTQNLLHRQHNDQIIMNPGDYLRATLSLLDKAIAGENHE